MPITPEIKVLEHFPILCPLGIRFWDSVTSMSVSEGLIVFAYPVGRPELRCEAFSNRSDVFAFHHLPGLRAVENGAGDDAFWASPPVTRDFVVEVHDLRRRFLPMNFRLTAPNEGLFRLDCLHSPLAETMDGVPLFSSATRALPAGAAVIRTELKDMQTGRPAPWVVLEATAHVRGRTVTAFGMSDEEGRAVIAFSYPEFGDAPVFNTSPPTGIHSLADRTWTFSLHALYESRPPSRQPPDLCALLEQQPAELLRSVSPVTPLGEVTLQFGRELILYREPSSDSTPLRPASPLLVNPAASPP